MIWCLLGGFLIAAVSLLVFTLLFAVVALKVLLAKPKKFTTLNGKHVFITGGSKGIGRALAVEAAKHGAHVTLIARNVEQLNEARQELEQLVVNSNQKVVAIPVDLTKGFDEISERLKAGLIGQPPVDVLINNAGGSIDGAFDELPIEAFEHQMKLNYLSAVYVTRYFVDQLKTQGPKSSEGCRIVFLSSQAGQLGLYGYAAYSPTKFALRGLAEALQMELKPYNVWITVSYPPNTQTEGFAAETLSMPKETRIISDTAGIHQPSEVAERILADVYAATFNSYIGSDGWLLATLSSGMSPETSTLSCLAQVMLNGVFRFVSLFYLRQFDAVVKTCAEEKRK